MAPQRTRELDEFLEPLRVTNEVVHQLSREFYSTFKKLAAESKDMFLSTPISESILRPAGRTRKHQGRYV